MKIVSVLPVIKYKIYIMLDLGTRWGCVVSVMPRPRFSPREGPPYPLYRRLGDPRAGLDTKALENPFAPVGDRTSIAQSSSPQPDTILTKLPGLYIILRRPNQGGEGQNGLTWRWWGNISKPSRFRVLSEDMNSTS
jgi:hypothetical protein